MFGDEICHKLGNVKEVDRWYFIVPLRDTSYYHASTLFYYIPFVFVRWLQKRHHNRCILKNPNSRLTSHLFTEWPQFPKDRNLHIAVLTPCSTYFRWTFHLRWARVWVWWFAEVQSTALASSSPAWTSAHLPTRRAFRSAQTYACGSQRSAVINSVVHV